MSSDTSNMDKKHKEYMKNLRIGHIRPDDIPWRRLGQCKSFNSTLVKLVGSVNCGRSLSSAGRWLADADAALHD